MHDFADVRQQHSRDGLRLGDRIRDAPVAEMARELQMRGVIPDGVLVISGQKIAAVGPAQTIAIPAGAQRSMGAAARSSPGYGTCTRT